MELVPAMAFAMPIGLRADFAAVLSDARALLAPLAVFLAVRVTGLVDRLAVFSDVLLMTPNIPVNFV
jgi:hypothetical protein